MDRSAPRLLSRRARTALLGLIGAATLWAAFAPVVLTPARADIASAKAIVDAAKTRGIVGEQSDGYLGLVTASASPKIAAAVAQINAGRAAVYRSAAAKAGVSPQAAAQAAAQQIFARMPAGQYYKPPGGRWTRKH